MIFMNVTIIYGTTKKANTYNCVQLLLNNLRLTTTINVTEFFLPKNLSFPCGDFHSYRISTENKLLHLNYTDYITDSLDKSDLIILACPVFTCDISTNMRLLLNDLYYKSIENNKISFMDNKIGLVMSTATGAGLFNTIKTMKRNLNFWGINNIFKFSKIFYEMNWEYVSLKTKLQVNKKISKLSNKILHLYVNSHSIKAPISYEIASSKIEPIFKNNHYNIINFGSLKRQSYHHGKRSIQYHHTDIHNENHTYTFLEF